MIEFTVPGRARTKGSMKPIRTKYGKIVLIQSNKREPAWAATVRGYAQRSTSIPAPSPTALTVSVVVTLLPSQTTRSRIGRTSTRKSLPWPGSGTVHPTKRSWGDVDKLLRSILDALTGVVYEDDSQVVKATIEKRFGDRDEVLIRIEEIKS